MRILYIGDIMGRAGRETVSQILPGLKKDEKIDFVIAQSENVSHGKGMLPKHMHELQDTGIDAFSGGDHSFDREQLYDILDDPKEPITRPANFNDGLPGSGWKIKDTPQGKVMWISLLGSIVGKEPELDNPLKTVDAILAQHQPKDAVTIVNFHGDYSSEKRIIGYYLDGRVNAVFGDHWHVPSADWMVLPKGTAHVTDVGMCGSIHSSLGVTVESVLPRWKDGKKARMQMDYHKPYQFNAVLIDTQNNSIEKIAKVVE